MRENRLKTIWENDGAVVNGWLHIPNSFSAEVMAHAGFDSITIDLQHGPINFDASLPMLQAMATTDVVPMARVPWNEPGIIMKMLDAGCYGIICPMVNTKEECEAFVGACRYPPIGYRSNGPTRASIYAGSDYGVNANDTVLAIAMIETVEAMNNMHEIMSVPGLDGVYVGPADLSISIFGGQPPRIDAPETTEAIKKVAAAAKEHGLHAGIHTGSVQMAQEMIAMGYQLVTVQSDASFLGNHAKQIVAGVKESEVAKEASSGIY